MTLGGVEMGGGGRALRDTHLSDDEAVAKMGHPGFAAEMGHPGFAGGMGHPGLAGGMGHN